MSTPICIYTYIMSRLTLVHCKYISEQLYCENVTVYVSIIRSCFSMVYMYHHS